MNYLIKLARQYGKPVQDQNAEIEYRFTLDGIDKLLAYEREVCLQHIGILVEAERDACLKAAAAVDDEGSYNQRLMKRRIRAAIRARSKP